MAAKKIVAYAQELYTAKLLTRNRNVKGYEVNVIGDVYQNDGGEPGDVYRDDVGEPHVKRRRRRAAVAPAAELEQVPDVAVPAAPTPGRDELPSFGVAAAPTPQREELPGSAVAAAPTPEAVAAPTTPAVDDDDDEAASSMMGLVSSGGSIDIANVAADFNSDNESDEEDADNHLGIFFQGCAKAARGHAVLIEELLDKFTADGFPKPPPPPPKRNSAMTQRGHGLKHNVEQMTAEAHLTAIELNHHVRTSSSTSHIIKLAARLACSTDVAHVVGDDLDSGKVLIPSRNQ